MNTESIWVVGYIWIRAVRNHETWQGWLCHDTEPVLIDTPALAGDVRRPYLVMNPATFDHNQVRAVMDRIENLGYEVREYRFTKDDPLRRS